MSVAAHRPPSTQIATATTVTITINADGQPVIAVESPHAALDAPQTVSPPTPAPVTPATPAEPPTGDAAADARPSTPCARCGRPLRSTLARHAGIGEWCARRAAEEDQ